MNTEFVEICKVLRPRDSFKKEYISFNELFNLKYPEDRFDENSSFNIHIAMLWSKFIIYAHVLDDIVMKHWNGHNKVPEFTEHVCKKGTKVRVWMVSRMGDVGITDNIVDPIGYDCRIDVEELHNWEIIKEFEL